MINNAMENKPIPGSVWSNWRGDSYLVLHFKETEIFTMDLMGDQGTIASNYSCQKSNWYEWFKRLR